MEAEEFAKRYARTIAFGAGVAAFSFAGFAMMGWTTFDFWIAALWGGVVWGGVYVLVFYVTCPRPDKLVSVPKPIINPELEYEYEEEPEEEEETAEPAPIIIDERLYRLNNNQTVRLPETVSPKHVGILREARRRGDLPAVNQHRLNSIGISRFSAAPNAATMIDFLKRLGAVDEAGQWTGEGDKMFPPPSPINGIDNRNLVV